MSTEGDKNAAVDSALEELLQLLELMRPPTPKRKPTKSLLGAVYADDTELVKRFLAAGSNPNQSNKYGSVLAGSIQFNHRWTGTSGSQQINTDGGEN